ncbi:hypothetical protein [Algicola sagamiensis]|uniref:hypothetical protein n=1 Tax=Algicola sagamiensis TaxID=163869 RepID=UPI000371003D|nr:hypothetical protein [Algicola sagamiensis]
MSFMTPGSELNRIQAIEEVIRASALSSIYVDHKGSDTYGNGTQDKPYKTIGKALSLRRNANDQQLTLRMNIVLGEGQYSLHQQDSTTARFNAGDVVNFMGDGEIIIGDQLTQVQTVVVDCWGCELTFQVPVTASPQHAVGGIFKANNNASIAFTHGLTVKGNKAVSVAKIDWGVGFLNAYRGAFTSEHEMDMFQVATSARAMFAAGGSLLTNINNNSNL